MSSENLSISENNTRIKGIDFDWTNPYSTSKLTKAVQEGNLKEVKRLMRMGISPNNADNRGCTPLHKAATCGNLEAAELLLKGGSYIDHVTVNGETALFYSCCSLSEGTLKTAKFLIDSGSNINYLNNDDLSPLHIACKNNRIDMVNLLLSSGADPNLKRSTSQTPIYFAIKYSPLSIDILMKSGASLNIVDFEGRSPVMYACSTNLSTFELLVPYLSEDILNYQSNEGWTLLMEASQFKNVDIAAKLLEIGVDPNVTDKRGLLALHIAAHSGNNKMFKMLLDCTINPEKYCSLQNNMLDTRSLPCLLIDSDMYESLKFLYMQDLHSDIYNCPVMVRGTDLVSPVSFVILYADEKIKYLDIMLTKTSVFCIDLEELIDSHNNHCDCSCTEILAYILEKKGSDIINENDLSIFLKCLTNRFTEGLKLIFQYCRQIEPEDVCLEYLKIKKANKETIDLKTEQFLFETTSNYYLICGNKFCSIPLLQQLSRSSLRKQMHKTNSPETFFESFNALKLPSQIYNYVMLK